MLPYAKANNLIFDRPLATNSAGAYEVSMTSRMISEDNFACLTLQADQLTVDFHDKKGRKIESVTLALM